MKAVKAMKIIRNSEGMSLTDLFFPSSVFDVDRFFKFLFLSPESFLMRIFALDLFLMNHLTCEKKIQTTCCHVPPILGADHSMFPFLFCFLS